MENHTLASNPFAAPKKHDHTNQGTVEIESSKAVAEAQGKLVIAKRFPRDEITAYEKLMTACSRRNFAEKATYSYPRSGSTISGPSIRLAEEAARCWGNVDFGIKELSQKDGESEMLAYCWDMETNVMSSQQFVVHHIRDTKNGIQKLTAQRDIYENNAYDIQQELRRTYPNLNLTVLIGSVRDRERLEDLFARYHPDLIYHAAAHKHVPLMEDSPCEAVKNNIFGTLNVAEMADRYRASRFLLISSDKAVNATNVMGATKRVCEMIIQMMDGRSKTEYVAVRFGNVLGSNGSVIPLFKKQIAAGGPVTVTDPQIIRYFMTIPEAVSLVLQAGVYAKGGEIYILDMGDRVRIDDLARNMIRLSGFEPDVDIPIVYTGLRPGEKLFEELLLSGEGMRKTQNDLIYIGKDQPFDGEKLEAQLQSLYQAAVQGRDVRDLLAQIVPEYRVPVHT